MVLHRHSNWLDRDSEFHRWQSSRFLRSFYEPIPPATLAILSFGQTQDRLSAQDDKPGKREDRLVERQ